MKVVSKYHRFLLFGNLPEMYGTTVEVVHLLNNHCMIAKKTTTIRQITTTLYKRENAATKFVSHFGFKLGEDHQQEIFVTCHFLS